MCHSLYYHFNRLSLVTNFKANKTYESESNSIPLLNETNLNCLNTQQLSKYILDVLERLKANM